MEVLFFCPTTEKTTAEQLRAILLAVPSGTGKPNLDVFDENSAPRGLENKKYDAVVIFYTAKVELSDALFEIVRYIDREKPLGRFIFLPKSDGKEIIPPILHPIRALQLQLFYYLSGETMQARLADFEQDWVNFVNPNEGGQSEKKGRGNQARTAGFGFILFASILTLVAAGLITVIVPIAQKTVLNLTPTAIRPPAATAFWLQESFRSVDTSTRWQEQHYYSGKQALQTEFVDSGLRLSAVPAVTEAVYQLDSLQNWPLDNLQSLTFSFALSAVDDPAAINALTVGLVQREDSSYQLECLVFSEKTDGKVQCQILSPAQKEALSEAIPVSLNEKHTVSLVFDPYTYSVKFFLDDHYYGQSEIKDVQYWRARSINLHIQVRLQKMSSGDFACELEGVDLAHQP